MERQREDAGTPKVAQNKADGGAVTLCKKKKRERERERKKLNALLIIRGGGNEALSRFDGEFFGSSSTLILATGGTTRPRPCASYQQHLQVIKFAPKIQRARANFLRGHINPLESSNASLSHPLSLSRSSTNKSANADNRSCKSPYAFLVVVAGISPATATP